MAYIVADRVRETTGTTGIGPFALAGAVATYRPFSAVVNSVMAIGDVCPYIALSTAGSGAWETGFGTLTAFATLTRTTILSTSNGDRIAINFGEGVKTISLGPIVGAWPPFNPLDNSLNLSINALADVTITDLKSSQVLKYNSTSKAWENVADSVNVGTVSSVGIDGSNLGLTASAPITSSGLIVLGGLLNVAHGGTGITTPLRVTSLADVALADLKGGQVLKYNSTKALWLNAEDAVNTGTVTSVTLSAGTTGLDVTNPTITVSGTSTLTGILRVAHGGTGITTPLKITSLADIQFVNLLGGQILKYNSESKVWANAPDSGTGGTVTSVAFSGGTTGLSVPEPPITSSGAFTLEGILNVDSGGTGLELLGTADQVLKVNTAGTALEYQTLAAPYLNELLDVTISELATGHVLKYDSVSKAWANAPDLDAGGTVTSVGFGGGNTGLTVTGSPITSKGTIVLGGALNIGSGGTGLSYIGTANQVLRVNTTGDALTYQTLIASKLVDLLDVGIANPVSGQVLKYNAGVWENADDAKNVGTVTSVGVVGGTTGLTTTNSPITASGDIMLGGVLAVIHGGTGITTSLKLNSLADIQFSATPLADKQVLKYDLASLKWVNATDVAGTGTVTSVAFDGGTTGLSANKGVAIITAGKFVLEGTLAVKHGGTGLTTPGIGAANHVLKVDSTGAKLTFQPLVTPYLNDLLDVTLTSPTNGQVLKYDSSKLEWVNAEDAKNPGTVTSVELSGGDTGLTATGGPIIAAGKFILGGKLAVAYGGTGITTPLVLPSLADVLLGSPLLNNQVLKYNSAAARWMNAADAQNAGTVVSVVFSTGTTGLSVTNSTVSGAVTMTLGAGILNVASGGTGLAKFGAIDSVLQVNTAGTALEYKLLAAPNLSKLSDVSLLNLAQDHYLNYNASVAKWENYPISKISGAGGTVTSVALSATSGMGLTVSGSPITSKGEFVLGGRLNIAYGGTGLNLIPPLTANHVLTVNTAGTALELKPVPTGTGGTAGVTSVNSQAGAVQVVAGANITIGSSNGIVTITGAAGGPGVTTLNNLTGPVTIQPSGNITVGLDSVNKVITIGSDTNGYQAIKTVTNTAYTLVDTDVQKLLLINYAISGSVVIPADPFGSFPVGSVIDFITVGNGAVYFVGGGVQLDAAGGRYLRTQFSGCTLIKISTAAWVLVGDTSL